jgi:hypothetical protein
MSPPPLIRLPRTIPFSVGDHKDVRKERSEIPLTVSLPVLAEKMGVVFSCLPLAMSSGRVFIIGISICKIPESIPNERSRDELLFHRAGTDWNLDGAV